MATWEDRYDDSDSSDTETPITAQKDTIGAKPDQAEPAKPVNTSNIKEVPPKPLVRSGGSDAAAASQAYNAAQPKVRILQRAPAANPQNSGNNSGNANSANTESVARFQANFEQKQRDYEAARKKLFEDSEAHGDKAE